MLALMAPDTAHLSRFLEVENFFLEHILLLILPIYLAFNRYYVVFPWSWTFCIATFCGNALYNSFVLTILSLMSGWNLNYTLSPPRGKFTNAVSIDSTLHS